MLNLNWIYTMSNKCMFFAGGRILFATCFFKALQAPPLPILDPLSLLTPFLIDLGPYFVSFRFNFESFQR